MTPDQRRWLQRAKELAADVKKGFEALRADSNLVAALLEHIKPAQLNGQGVDTLDAFLKDMLPLADCCASLEARLPDENQGNDELACRRLLLAGGVSRVSWQLLTALHSRFALAASAPSTDLINRMALSATVPIRWLPKALRAAAGRELGQAVQHDLLELAMVAAAAAMLILGLMNYKGRHTDMLRTTLYTPAALASLLGNLAAVHARFARSPGTFKGQAKEWASLAVLASNLLDSHANKAVAAAVEESEGAQQQLATALLPYAAHLLKAADVKSAAWLAAWGKLVRALTSQAVWPGPESGLGARQQSAAVAEGLLRLLRVLPPLHKPPRSYHHDCGWIPIPLDTARAAAVAASKALKVAGPAPYRQEQVAALREMQQRGFHMLVALLPITVDILGAAAERVAAPEAGAGAEEVRLAQAAFGKTLWQLLQLMQAGGALSETVQGLNVPPKELAAAGEAALRLATQAAALAEPPKRNLGSLEEVLYVGGMFTGRQMFSFLLPAAQQEASAAPEQGGVRPSLQAQLCLVHTACKFARVALAPGAAASTSSSSTGSFKKLEEELQAFVRLLFVHCNYLLSAQLLEESVPEGRAPLTPAEKRALTGAALALTAAGAAVLRLLPECPARETQRLQLPFDTCRFLLEPGLAASLLAQNAELPEQLIAGLVEVMKMDPEPWVTPPPSPSLQGARALNKYDYCVAVERAVQANRYLGTMMLAGAAGEALEAAVRESLQGPALEVATIIGWEVWVRPLRTLIAAAESCLNSSGRAAAAVLHPLLQIRARVPGLPQEGWEAVQAVRAAADEWLSQEVQQQWRQEQLVLFAEAVATRACSNLACTNLSGASEAGLKARQCSSCRCARYCSTACQRADWGAGHKAVCKRLQAKKEASV